MLNASFWLLLDSLGIPGVYYNRIYFFYFSFLNQLPSFVCGIYMYSIYETDKKEHKQTICYFLLFFLFFCILLLFKYSNYEYGSIYTPYLMGLSFVYLFELTRRPLNKVSAYTITIMNIGKNSYGMYLLNTFIAWEAGALVHKYLVVYNETLIYLIWLPTSIVILYFLSIYYEKIISSFSRLIFK